MRRLAVLLCGGAVALAACSPLPPPSRGPAKGPASVPQCGPTATPSSDNPVEYVAVIDEPGAGAPEVETFTAYSPEDKDAKVDKLSKRRAVVAVDENEAVSALVDGTDDPRYAAGEQWGLANSGFESAWTNVDGADVTIAVIDTGVNAAHEDLTGKVLQGIDFYAGDEDTNPAGDSDYGRVDHNGHGTHVAGIAAATDNAAGGLGGAPGASILPVRVLGVGGGGSTEDVISGIYWATDNGADVINMSLGGSGCSSSERVAVEYAETEGVVVVAAAGNSNSSTPIYPAGFGGSVVSVGATTQTDQKASFSNWGAPYVDVAAPGVSILSTTIDPLCDPASTPDCPPVNDEYKLLSGTSMSSAFVAAVAALVLEQCPSIANDDPGGSSRHDKVMSLLQSTGSPSIASLGAALVQAGAATAAACPA